MTKLAFTRPGLKRAGFEGFVTVEHLRTTRCAAIPTLPGIYVVLREATTAPRFRRESPAGWFKGEEPTVDPNVLRARWLLEVPVLYIGKATAGASGRRHLRRRVTELVDFGAGRPVGHRGGRYLWQVQGSSRFVLAWRVETAPTRAENDLLGQFLAAFGQLPFANLTGARGDD